MAIRISDLARETRKITINIGLSEPLEIEYRVMAYTPDLEDIILGTQDRPAAALAHILNHLVVSWNLVDDDDKPYMLDDEHMRKLPLPVMLRIFQAIAEDMRPNPPTAGT